MTSKERVHAALKCKSADRVPVFMWFHPDTAKRLSETLEITPSQVDEAMGNDIFQRWIGNNYAMEGIVHDHDGEKHLDFWGVEWVKDGCFNQICRYPLENANEQEILNYRFPLDQIGELVHNMEPLSGKSKDCFIGCDVSPCVFELTCRLMGMENAIINLAANPETAKILLERAGQFSLKLAEKACDSYKFDWLWTGDDVGGQQNIMMSPDCWREMIKPQLANVIRAGKKRGLWVAYHSCGSIYPIISDLIEIGVDVLNPIQCNCPGMNPLELKKEFGGKLAFMGGVDTQELLPKGTVGEVRRQVGILLDGMTADGGGYIFAASHTIPPETPLENIFAMYEVAGISRDEIFDKAASIRIKDPETRNKLRYCQHVTI